MGGKTQGGEGGSTVKGKRTPVLRQILGNSLSITDVYFTLDNKISRIDQSLRTVGDRLFRSVHFSDDKPLSRNGSGRTFS